ncbi:MAG: hypothetical protein NZ870_02480 [bacterium]|nr:hypothetical protein [bacterium]
MWELFSGSYFSSLDEKNRITIPKSFRVSKLFVFQPEHPSCIAVYTLNTWQKALDGFNLVGMKKRIFERLVFSQACVIEVDSIGRVVLPKHLVMHASIKDRVTVIGCGKRFEIWDYKRWGEYFKKNKRKIPWELI